jgi:hypothetical protein
LDFDAEFNRFDESLLHDQHISKNISQLSHSIDSVSKIVTSMEVQQSKEIMQNPYLSGVPIILLRLLFLKKLPMNSTPILFFLV